MQIYGSFIYLFYFYYFKDNAILGLVNDFVDDWELQESESFLKDPMVYGNAKP